MWFILNEIEEKIVYKSNYVYFSTDEVGLSAFAAIFQLQFSSFITVKARATKFNP
jgi:hypothetical protein